ncbi:hypothetical protein LINGRAHAP2_LOCUS537, partial [Linum grandiflorum]
MLRQCLLKIIIKVRFLILKRKRSWKWHHHHQSCLQS